MKTRYFSLFCLTLLIFFYFFYSSECLKANHHIMVIPKQVSQIFSSRDGYIFCDNIKIGDLKFQKQLNCNIPGSVVFDNSNKIESSSFITCINGTFKCNKVTSLDTPIISVGYNVKDGVLVFKKDYVTSILYGKVIENKTLPFVNKDGDIVPSNYSIELPTTNTDTMIFCKKDNTYKFLTKDSFLYTTTNNKILKPNTPFIFGNQPIFNFDLQRTFYGAMFLTVTKTNSITLYNEPLLYFDDFMTGLVYCDTVKPGCLKCTKYNLDLTKSGIMYYNNNTIEFTTNDDIVNITENGYVTVDESLHDESLGSLNLLKYNIQSNTLYESIYKVGNYFDIGSTLVLSQKNTLDLKPIGNVQYVGKKNNFTSLALFKDSTRNIDSLNLKIGKLKENEFLVSSDNTLHTSNLPKVNVVTTRENVVPVISCNKLGDYNIESSDVEVDEEGNLVFCNSEFELPQQRSLNLRPKLSEETFLISSESDCCLQEVMLNGIKLKNILKSATLPFRNKFFKIVSANEVDLTDQLTFTRPEKLFKTEFKGTSFYLTPLFQTLPDFSLVLKSKQYQLFVSTICTAYTTSFKPKNEVTFRLTITNSSQQFIFQREVSQPILSNMFPVTSNCQIETTVKVNPLETYFVTVEGKTDGEDIQVTPVNTKNYQPSCLQVISFK